MPPAHSHKRSKPTFDATVAGTLLRQERERLGLTQRDVAAKAGVSQRTVVNIEQGIGGVSLKNIEAVVLALDIDLVDIIRQSRRPAAQCA